VWRVKVDELVAQPTLRQMRDELLESEILHADEMPVPGIDAMNRVNGERPQERARVGPQRRRLRCVVLP